MSLLTLEVEIQHGQVVPREPDKVPELGHGFLTILSSETSVVPVNLFDFEPFGYLR